MDASLSVTPTVLSSGDLNIQAILPHDFQREIQPCAPVGSPKQKSILLLDCRPFLLFNDQHILMAKNSMIPSIVKRRSRGCVPLSTLVPCEEKRARLLSGAFHLIVVYDQDSDDLTTDPKQSNLGIVLRSLLFHVSSDKLRFLKGGYSRFNELFPELCVSQNSLCDNLENTMRISKDESYAKQIQESGPAEVLSYLYLGDSRHAAKKDLLKELGITAIVNVSKHCNNHFPEDFVYKQIPVDDKTDTELAPWFNDAIGFIDSQKTRGGKVLVHCQAGVSRSATICVAYIMFKRKCPMDEAFDRVQKQRAVISPNLSFMRQLRNFERKLEIESPASPRRPMLSPCRLSSNTPGFWCSAGQAADESYRWALTAGSMVSPLLSPTTPFLSSPILSPI